MTEINDTYFEDKLEELMENYEFDLSLSLQEILADFYWNGINVVVGSVDEDEEVDSEEAEG